MNKAPLLAVNIAGIGDLILSSKSLRSLKKSNPDRELWLITSTEAAILAKNYPYIDQVVPFPIREFTRGRHSWKKLWQSINAVRKEHYQCCMNLYLIGSSFGAAKMGFLFLLLDADAKIGHDAHGFGYFLTLKAPADLFLKQHFVDAMCDIAVLAGAVPDEGGIDLYWDKVCEQKWTKFIDEHKNFPLIGINPGGDRTNRRWNPEHFSIVGERLLRDYSANILLFGGPGEECIAAEIQRRIPSSQVISLAGKLELNELSYIISRLDLFITNDSGPMHIAAAAGTPIVAIFGPENPLHLRPYAPQSQYRVVFKDVPCRPCSKTSCKNPICLSSILPKDVFHACEDLLMRVR